MPRTYCRYGWTPDLPDARDHVYQLPMRGASLPASADLRAGCPPVCDQGGLGSCTANAIGAAIEFDQTKQKLTASTPSRLFIYYNERVIEGSVETDSGAQIRDGIKSVASDGACPEPMWPYIEENFASRPAASCYSFAKLHPAVQYARVTQDAVHLKSCLAAGYPFVFGFTVYESFEGDDVARSGMVEMPGETESVVGGHAVMAVGYNDSVQRFLVRNSWGPGWGVGGYFTIPYAYLTDSNLADDFWVIRVVK
jgi:C1A family cysteine protease